ncbi:MAG: hypothetical protein E6J85_01650 [Deltaproteobacteria bacterium]|nr:MAG: hypothetical protein E6J85_01650 [Deltaproteobacteria bacterium]
MEIALSKAKLASSLHVQLNGRDVSSAFAVRGNGRILGLVSGLVNGNNVLVASTSKSHAASLAITNHPIGGPVIAGPQTAPFVCATPTAQPATATLAASNASGLSTSAVDVQCNIATETFLFYRTTAACTGVLRDPSPVTATSPTSDACRSGVHHHRPGRDRSVHRPRRARDHRSRHLRHRGALHAR